MSGVLAAQAARPAPAGEPSSQPPRWRPSHHWLFVGIGLLLAIHRSERNLSDSDVLWGARSGIDILKTGHLPHSDAYSWTASGRTWIPNSWAWNVVLGAIHQATGDAGFYLLVLVLGIGLGALVSRLAESAGADPQWSAMAFMVLGPVALFIAPRAQAAALLPMLAILLLLKRALVRSGGELVRATAAVLALQIVWMNVHSSGVLGPVLTLAVGSGLAITTPAIRRAVMQRTLALAAAMALACLATPYGLAPISHAFEVRNASAGLMQEWLPPGLSTPVQIVGIFLSAVGVLATWSAWRRRRWDALFVNGLLTIASFTAIRFDPLIAAVAVPEIALAAASLRVRAAMVTRTLAAGIAAVALLAIAGSGSFGRLGPWVASPRLVSELPSGCRVLNDMLVGGPITLHRPDVKVALDSRNDMYGRRIVLDDMRLMSDEPGTEQRLADAHVDCVLTLSSYPVVAHLRNDPQWRIVGSDAARTLLVRRSVEATR